MYVELLRVTSTMVCYNAVTSECNGEISKSAGRRISPRGMRIDTVQYSTVQYICQDGIGTSTS